MEIKRNIRLHTFFVRYAACVMIGAAVILMTALILFAAAMEAGWIVPANYAEKLLSERAKQIQSAAYVDKNLIPETCWYGVYDREGKYLYGTFQEKEKREIWNIYAEGERGKEGYYFRSFDRKGEVCVVKYRMASGYTNDFLQKYFPAADWTFIGSAVLVFFIYMFWLAGRFGASISKELSVLEKVTEKVGRQELDFARETSKIAEVDAVLESMEQMKEALKESLHRQWNLEQTRREQVAALAHDIKTPLTILRGSAELSLEADGLEEAKAYAEEICEEVTEIEEYLRVLQEMLCSEKGQITGKTKIVFSSFVEKIRKQTESLTKTRRMTVCVREVPENCMKNLQTEVEEKSLYRAWMNIIANSIAYGKEEGTIRLTVQREENMLSLVTEDDGRGFSKEELVRATEQFYRGDKSRGERGHYGLGLAIAKRFTERQGGILRLENSEEMQGAKVTISFLLEAGNSSFEKEE